MSESAGTDKIVTDVVVNFDVTGLEAAKRAMEEMAASVDKVGKAGKSGSETAQRGKVAAVNWYEALKKVAEVTDLLDKANKKTGQSVATTGTKASTASRELDKLAKSLRAVAEANSKMKAFGAKGGGKDTEELKAWQKEMEKTGTPIVGRPKDIASLRNNMQTLKQTLHDTSKAGIATAGTIKSIGTGAASSFQRGLTHAEQFRVKLFALKRGMQSILYTWQDVAKNMQWTGRQMMMGITLPLTALATKATAAFMSINREFFHLKKVTEFRDIDKQTGQLSEFYKTLKSDIRELSVEYAYAESKMTGLFKDIAALGIDNEVAIRGWAEGISQISRLGEIDLDKAMEFFRVTNALFAQGDNTEKLKQTVLMMAQMNAIADETTLQLQDMANAFPEVAPVMAKMGFDAAGVAGALAAMYKRGIPAVEAAHALKFAFNRLIVPVKNAKDVIDELGFSFFTMEGAANIETADAALMKLASTMDDYSQRSQMEAIGKMFGLRQSARMLSFLDDVKLGMQELDKAAEDGKITLTEYGEITSDWARSRVAAGKIEVEGIDPVLERYKQAMEFMRKEPHFMWDQLKVQLQSIMADVGAILTPHLLSFGKKLVSFLELIMKMPPHIHKAIAAVGVLAAAMGPLIYVFAQAGLAMTTFGRIATGLLRTGVKDIMPDQAAALLKKDPTRTDIGQQGSRMYQFAGRKKRGTELVRSVDDIKRVTGATVAASGAMDKLSIETLTSTAKMKGLEAQGWRTAAAVKSINLDMQNNLKAIQADMANQMGSMTGGPSQMTPAAMIGARQLAGEKVLESGAGLDVAKAIKKDALEAKAVARYGETAGGVFGANFMSNFKAKVEAGKGGVFGRLTRAAQKAGEKIQHSSIGLLAPKMGQQYRRVASGPERMIEGAKHAKPPSAKDLNIAKVKGVFSAGAVGAGGFLQTILKIALTLGKFTVIIGLVTAAVGGLIYLFKGFKENWEVIRKAMEPGVQAITNAWERMKESFEVVKQKFQEIIGTLGGEGGAGGQQQSFWEALGGWISKFAQIVAGAMDFAIKAIEWAMPFIEGIAYVVRNTIGFIQSVMTGDWRNAILFFVGILWEGVRYAAIVLEYLLDAFIYGLQGLNRVVQVGVQIVVRTLMILPEAVALIVRTIGSLFGQDWGHISVAPIYSAINGAFDSLDSSLYKARDFNITKYIDDNLRKKMPKVIKDGIQDPVEKAADDDEIKQAADHAGKELGGDLGKGVNDGVKDALKAGDWFKDWLSAVKSRLDEAVQEIKKKAIEAFEKAHEEQMKLYDDKIEAINKMEKAEEKLLRTQEYIEKRKSMLYRRSIDLQNYNRNRALAIYEGRIDDARMLDLEWKKSTLDFNKDLRDLDQQRARDLIKEAREAEKDRIKAEKDAAEERHKIQKEAFEKQLDLYTEYAPKTIAEFDSMMTSINNLLRKYGVNGWPEMARDGTSRYLEVIKKANQDVREDFAWGGESAVTAWLAAFAAPDVIEILKSRFKDAGAAAKDAFGEGMGGGGDMGDFEGPDMEGAGGGVGGGGGGIGGPKPLTADFGEMDTDANNIGKWLGAIATGFISVWKGWGLIKLALKGAGGVIGFAALQLGKLLIPASALSLGMKTAAPKMGIFASLLARIAVPAKAVALGAGAGAAKVGLLAGIIAKIAAPFKIAGAVIGGVGAKIGLVVAALAPVAAAAAPVVAVVAAIAAAVAALYFLFDSVRGVVDGVWDSINAAWDAIIDLFTGDGPLLDRIKDLALKMIVLFNDLITMLPRVLFNALREMAEGAAKYTVQISKAVWGWISSAIPSAVSALGNFLGAIIEWIEALPGRIASFFTQTIPAFIGWIINAIPGLVQNLGEFMGSLVGWILKQPVMILINMKRLTESMVNWVIDAIPGLLNNLAEWGTSFGLWLGEFISSIPERMRECADAITNWVTDSISSLLDNLQSWATSFGLWAGEFVVSIPDRVAGAAVAIVSWVYNAIPNLINALRGYWDSMFEWVENFVGNLTDRSKEITEASLKWIYDAIKNLPENLVRFGIQIYNWVRGLPSQLRNWFRSAMSTMGEIGKQLIVSLINGIFSLGNWIWDRINDFVGGFVKGFLDAFQFGSPSQIMLDMGADLIESLITGIQMVVGNAIGFVSEIMRGFIGPITDWVTESISSLVSNLGSWAQSFVSWAGRFVASIPGHIAEAGRAIVGWVWDSISNLGTALSTFQSNVINWIGGFIRDVASNAGQMAQAILKWIQDAARDLPGNLANFGIQIYNWVQGLPGQLINWFITVQTEMRNIGEELVRSLVGGVLSMASWVGDRVSDFAGGVVGFFRSAFKFGSPSKIMMNMGEELVDSIVEGIENGQGIAQAIREVMVKALDEAKDGFDRAKREIMQYWNQVDSGIETQMNYQSAIDETNAVLAESTELIKQRKSPTDLDDEAQRNLMRTLMSQKDAILNAAFAHAENTVATDGASKAAQNGADAALLMAASMRQQLTDMGYTEEGAKELIETLGLTPDKLYTYFLQPNLIETLANLDRVKKSGEEINQMRITVGIYANTDAFYAEVGRLKSNLNAQIPAGQTPFTDGQIAKFLQHLPTETFAREKGGPVTAGKTYIVGEKGPEIFTPNISGQIIPNNKIQSSIKSTLSTPLDKSLRDVIGGKVFAAKPRDSFTFVNSPAKTKANNISSGGDTHIYVDTFIGEERWFNELADKYDLKVSSKKARAAGTTSRVISSYNQNQRGGFSR